MARSFKELREQVVADPDRRERVSEAEEEIDTKLHEADQARVVEKATVLCQWLDYYEGRSVGDEVYDAHAELHKVLEKMDTNDSNALAHEGMRLVGRLFSTRGAEHVEVWRELQAKSKEYQGVCGDE